MRNRSERFSSRTRALQISLAAVLFLLCLASSLRAQETEPNMPMRAHSEDGAESRWLHKKVLDSRVIDSMEDLSSWSFAGVGEMTLTTDRAKDGKYALRLRSTTNVARAGGDEEWEDQVATRNASAQTSGNSGTIRFEDIAAKAGLRFRTQNSPTANKNQIETMVAGVALIDYDG